MNYRCIVVEDEMLIRMDLIRRIQLCDPSFQIVGEAMDGQTALDLVDSLMPDVVFTDVRIPVMDGLELARSIRFNYPSVQIVVISGYSSFDYVQKALRNKVVDYLLKPVTDDSLREVISKICVNIAGLPAAGKRNGERERTLSPEEIVSYVSDYIAQNYNSAFTLDNIAENIQFSPMYISRLFKKATSQTPLQYLIALRLREACRLLLSDPDLSVAEIGIRTGYEDPSYFSRIFRKHIGMYPSEYRLAKSGAEDD